MNENEVVPRYSPDKLLYHFNRTSFGLIILLAFFIHAVFILGLSVNYIRDRWIDPVGAEKRKAVAAAAADAAMSNRLALAAPPAANQPVTGTNAGAAPLGATNAVVAATAAVMSPAVNPAQVTGLAARTNTIMMKQITEAAKSNEIPRAPDDLGISIQDTNPK